MLSVHDVARELRARLPDAGDVKIHKLVYYCQGWHVAWTGSQMFSERLEAWTNGPVVADLRRAEKRNWQRPPAQSPDDEQLVVIEYVVGRYGGYTGRELIRKTHLEDPWRDASEIDDGFTTGSPEISDEALKNWFCRDEEFESHRIALEDLGQRRDIYGFDGPALPDGLHQATLRFLGAG